MIALVKLLFSGVLVPCMNHSASIALHPASNLELRRMLAAMERSKVLDLP